MQTPFHVSKYRVAVIIPCFNAERYVREAVASVRVQTYQDWCLIAVDDGSTDSTLKVLGSIANEFGPRFLIRSGENRGACHARNLAVRETKSELVAFLDADDYWHPEKLVRQVELLSLDDGAVGVTTGYSLAEPSTGRSSRELNFQWSRSELINWTLLGRRAPALNSTLMVKRDALLEVGGYDEELISYADDLDLAWRLQKKGRLRTVPANLATLRVSGEQIHRDFSKMTNALGLVYDHIAKDEPLVARRAKRNLKLYLSLRQTFGGSFRIGFVRVIFLFLSSPNSSLLFVMRKMRDFGRLDLRHPDRSSKSEIGI